MLGFGHPVGSTSELTLSVQRIVVLEVQGASDHQDQFLLSPHKVYYQKGC